MHLREWREGNERGGRRPGRAGCFCCFIIKIGTGGGDAPCAPIYSVKVSGLGWLVNDGGRCTRAKMKVRSSHSIIWIECCAWVPAISSFFPFFFSMPALTSPRLTARLVTPPRSHRNEHARGFLTCGRLLWRTKRLFFPSRGARKRQIPPGTFLHISARGAFSLFKSFLDVSWHIAYYLKTFSLFTIILFSAFTS